MYDVSKLYKLVDVSVVRLIHYVFVDKICFESIDSVITVILVSNWN